jgi:flagellar protein FlaG
MTTQIGQSPGLTIAGIAASKPVHTKAQTEGAVKPVIAPADTGEEFRSQEKDTRQPLSGNRNLASNARLTIEKDSDTGKYVYKTVDRETGKVIRQWPREKLLKAITEHQNVSGLIVDKKV